MRRVLAILDTPAGYFLAACAAMGLLWAPVLASVLMGQDLVEKNAAELDLVAQEALQLVDPEAQAFDEHADPMVRLDDLTWRSRLTP